MGLGQRRRSLANTGAPASDAKFRNTPHPALESSLAELEELVAGAKARMEKPEHDDSELRAKLHKLEAELKKAHEALKLAQEDAAEEKRQRSLQKAPTPPIVDDSEKNRLAAELEKARQD